MVTKQLETISGAVESVNSKGTGIKLLGEWLNISQYHPIVPMPVAGQLVEVQIERTDRGCWINSLAIVDGAVSPAAASSSNRDRAIARMSALRSAAIFCGHKSTVLEHVGTPEVLKIADSFLRWLEREEEPAAD